MIAGLCLGLLKPQYEGCTQIGATHFKQAMEELEGIPSRTQTHWQAGNLIERTDFLKLFNL